MSKFENSDDNGIIVQYKDHDGTVKKAPAKQALAGLRRRKVKQRAARKVG